MAQIDSNATKEQLAQMEREFARKRAAEARKRAKELARLSEERELVDEKGTHWTYVTVDNSFVRITACVTSADVLAAPDAFENKPVREVGQEAFSHLLNTREIIMPDGIESIGPYAFRGCEHLERLVLPANTNAFRASWIAKCPSLEELVLPASLEEVTSEVLSNDAVKRLVIGRHTKTVRPGALEKSTLETLVVDEANEFLSTDGTCIYAADGSKLVALAKRVASYEVARGCKRIGRKAFMGASDLEHVVLPTSLEVIEEFAFAYSGITSLQCPPHLACIGVKACLHCLSLHEAVLNDGLRFIGDEAFACSSLASLRIPRTVEHIGSLITIRTNVRHAGPDATFVISAQNESYFIDEQGCLYRNDSDGVHLTRMLEPLATSYIVQPHTVAIDEKAFAHHGFIEAIALPEGLRRIGEGAFKVCRKLSSVTIPDSLESVGADAFLDTAIQRFRIPEGLVNIGKNALVTDGAHHEGAPPALREIDVDARNPLFFMHTGMLCRRLRSGVSIVVFTCSCDKVEFPQETLEVEDYAFNNAFGIRELYINAKLHTIGACGLSVMSQIRHVRIDVEKPIEGMTSFVLRFPATTHSVHGFLLALGGLGHLYLPDIMAQYDNCIASSRDYYDTGKTENASAYEQVKLIIDRLNESILLTDSNKQRYHSLVARNIEEICTDIARHDDREALGQLADLGLLTADNLDGVVASVAKLQDAAMTAYLLELKRIRFGQRTMDFDL